MGGGACCRLLGVIIDLMLLLRVALDVRGSSDEAARINLQII